MSTYNALVCDRCGKEIRYVGGILNFESKKTKKWRRAQYQACRPRTPYEKRAIDLCDVCTADFDKWIKKED